MSQTTNQTHWSADDQHEQHRLAAIVVLVLLCGLITMLLWLASLGGGSVESLDYFPM